MVARPIRLVQPASPPARVAERQRASHFRPHCFMSCLSDTQKRLLSQLSARAYSKQSALARGRGVQPDMSYKAYDEFRHAQVALATGKAGLRCCSQDDYLT